MHKRFKVNGTWVERDIPGGVRKSFLSKVDGNDQLLEMFVELRRGDGRVVWVQDFFVATMFYWARHRNDLEFITSRYPTMRFAPQKPIDLMIPRFRR